MGLKRARLSSSKLQTAVDADGRQPSAIAEAAGLWPSHFAYLRKQPNPPSVKIQTIRKIARVLGVDPKELLAKRAEIRESAKYTLFERLGFNWLDGAKKTPVPKWPSARDSRLKFAAFLPEEWKNEGGLWFVQQLFTLANWRQAFSPDGARVSWPSEEKSLAFARAMGTLLGLAAAGQEVREDALVYLSAMLTPNRAGARAAVEGVWMVWDEEERAAEAK